MKGNTRIIETLNKLLTGEMSAANQYFIHSGMYTEEDHTHWLEQQPGLIDKVGLDNYIQSQMD